MNVPGGAAKKQLYADTSSSGIQMTGELLLVSDGESAASVLLVEVVGYDSELLPLQKQLVENLRVGSKVLSLPAANPGSPIEGVFQGPWDKKYSWITFDPRGYLVKWNEWPFDPLLVLQQGSGLLRYEVASDKITFQHSDNSKREEDFKREDGVLIIGKNKYKRLDGPQCDGLVLEGRYQTQSMSTYGNTGMSGAYSSSTISRKTFTFSKDGTFQEEGYSSSVGSAVTDTLDPVNTMVYTDSANNHAKDKGTYQIKNNIIELRYPDAQVKSLSFFCTMENEKVYEGTLFIDGATYSKR